MPDNYLKGGLLLPLMEEFYSIQGEGFNTGKPAYFIRIGGCDIGCEWCDTKLSWNASHFPPVHADDIISRILDCPANDVVVTGGEPCMYDLDYFTGSLNKKGIKTYLETSGAYTVTGVWNWICLSPKEHTPPLKGIYSRADELKVIIRNESDFNWAEKNAKKVKKNCYLYLQPEWSVSSAIINNIVEYVKKNPKWRVSIQSHKYMKIP